MAMTLELNPEDMTLNQEAMDEIQDIFMSFDLNGDGKISRKEISKVFMRLRIYMPDEIVQEAFKESDADLSGDLDFEEFKKFINCLKIKDNEFALKKMFEELDTEKKGEISAKQMEEYLIRMGHLRLDDEKLIQNIMSMDIEKQETIKFEDFAKYMSLFF